MFPDVPWFSPVAFIQRHLSMMVFRSCSSVSAMVLAPGDSARRCVQYFCRVGVMQISCTRAFCGRLYALRRRRLPSQSGERGYHTDSAGWTSAWVSDALPADRSRFLYFTRALKYRTNLASFCQNGKCSALFTVLSYLHNLKTTRAAL